MADTPVLLRIPFSPYCRKAEWALSQAGIAYRSLDVLPTGMTQIERANPHGMVPMMVDGDTPVFGSERITRWAADHARPDTPPLFPESWSQSIEEWEAWADNHIGPIARREAYRVAYNQPFKLTRKPLVRVVARVARPQVLGILKFYKARRFDDEDEQAIPELLARIGKQLDQSGTGYLFGPRPTAADLATAAMVETLTYAEPARKYAEMDGWMQATAHLERVRPAKLSRVGRRWIREKDWQWLESVKPDAPTIAA